MSATEILAAEHWSLPGLAIQINNTVRAAEADAKSSMQRALEAGKLLAEAKAAVAHGEWQNWLTAHCEVAPRTAQAYMKLAKRIPELPASEAQRVADLPVREAIRAIVTDPVAPPRTDTIRIAARDDATRTADTWRKVAAALRDAARHVDFVHELKGNKVAALRKKLTDALTALDDIADADANASAKGDGA